MRFKIFLHPKAAQFLEKADPTLSKRIKNRLRGLRFSPEKKSERLRYSNFWRLRIGNYRAIYEINVDERRVIILYIGRRRDVYDDFSKLL